MLPFGIHTRTRIPIEGTMNGARMHSIRSIESDCDVTIISVPIRLNFESALFPINRIGIRINSHVFLYFAQFRYCSKTDMCDVCVCVCCPRLYRVPSNVHTGIGERIGHTRIEHFLICMQIDVLRLINNRRFGVTF